MANRIQLRRGTASNWTSVNPVLNEGEAGFESDTYKLKIGNGVTAWNSLSYFPGNLETLSNIAVSNIQTNDVLKWNGSAWTNSPDAGGADLTAFSVVTNTAGSPSLSYNNTNGVFTYTPPNLSSYLQPVIDTTSATATSLADAATANLDLTGGTAYILYKIQVSHAAWVRVYTSSANRTADAGRAQGVDPGITSGVIAEAITTGPAEIVSFAPAINGYNNDSPVTSSMPIAVTNLSGSTNNITVTVTKLTMVA